MAAVFLREDANELLHGKCIVFIGDSNYRCLYKDLVQLLLHNTLVSSQALKKKMEKSYNTDKLIQGSKLTNGRDFREVRSFVQPFVSVHFYFITRCFGPYMDTVIKELEENIKPDIILMNSCLWDLTRWGPQGVDQYKENLPKIMQKLKSALNEKCLLIWTTTLPLSENVRGGFLIPELQFLKRTLRFDVMEANQFANEIANTFGFDVLDIHYHLQLQIPRREKDGLHWNTEAARHMTNLILTHISISYEKALPKHFIPQTLQSLLKTNMKPLQSEPVPKPSLLSTPSIPTPLLSFSIPKVFNFGKQVNFGTQSGHIPVVPSVAKRRRKSRRMRRKGKRILLGKS